jgi:hypothetical protein
MTNWNVESRDLQFSRTVNQIDSRHILLGKGLPRAGQGRHKLELLYWRNRTGVKHENTISGMPSRATAPDCTHNAALVRYMGGEMEKEGESREQNKPSATRKGKQCSSYSQGQRGARWIHIHQLSRVARPSKALPGHPIRLWSQSRRLYYRPALARYSPILCSSTE